MIDLHEGVLREFAERAVQSTDFDENTWEGMFAIRSTQENNARRTEGKSARRAIGRCINCATVVLGTTRRCAKHAEQHRNAERLRRHAKRATLGCQT
jgi:hypothetical protein